VWRRAVTDLVCKLTSTPERDTRELAWICAITQVTGNSQIVGIEHCVARLCLALTWHADGRSVGRETKGGLPLHK
jgi:hypothetical protein